MLIPMNLIPIIIGFGLALLIFYAIYISIRSWYEIAHEKDQNKQT